MDGARDDVAGLWCVRAIAGQGKTLVETQRFAMVAADHLQPAAAPHHFTGRLSRRFLLGKAAGQAFHQPVQAGSRAFAGNAIATQFLQAFDAPDGADQIVLGYPLNVWSVLKQLLVIFDGDELRADDCNTPFDAPFDQGFRHASKRMAGTMRIADRDEIGAHFRLIDMKLRLAALL